jgi:predicted nucleic acid-binding protein
MKIVLDTSVAAKIALPEVDSDKAIAVRDGFINGIHDLLAPDFFPAELAHALTKAERQKRITVGEAEKTLAERHAQCPSAHSIPSLVAASDRNLLCRPNGILRLPVRRSCRA